MLLNYIQNLNNCIIFFPIRSFAANRLWLESSVYMLFAYAVSRTLFPRKQKSVVGFFFRFSWKSCIIVIFACVLSMFECNNDESNHLRSKIVVHVIWIWNVKLHRTDAKCAHYTYIDILTCTRIYLSMKNGKRNSKVIKSLLRFCYSGCCRLLSIPSHLENWVLFTFGFVKWCTYKNRFKWRSDLSVCTYSNCCCCLFLFFLVHHYHHRRRRHLFSSILSLRQYLQWVLVLKCIFLYARMSPYAHSLITHKMCARVCVYVLLVFRYFTCNCIHSTSRM